MSQLRILQTRCISNLDAPYAVVSSGFCDWLLLIYTRYEILIAHDWNMLVLSANNILQSKLSCSKLQKVTHIF